MLCQECKKENATIHITQVVTGQTLEYHLCGNCAIANDDVNAMLQNKVVNQTPFDFIANNFLTGFLGSGFAADQQAIKAQNRPQCRQCGMTYEEFTKSGMLGCVNCYASFGNALQPVLKKIHGNNYHTGKIPVKSAGKIKTQRELENLRMQLNKAIYSEEYERAAVIRDKIRELEQTKHSG